VVYCVVCNIDGSICYLLTEYDSDDSDVISVDVIFFVFDDCESVRGRGDAEGAGLCGGGGGTGRGRGDGGRDGRRRGWSDGARAMNSG
jgi:hypothetical protein